MHAFTCHKSVVKLIWRWGHWAGKVWAPCSQQFMQMPQTFSFQISQQNMLRFLVCYSLQNLNTRRKDLEGKLEHFNLVLTTDLQNVSPQNVSEGNKTYLPQNISSNKTYHHKTYLFLVQLHLLRPLPAAFKDHWGKSVDVSVHIKWLNGALPSLPLLSM